MKTFRCGREALVILARINWRRGRLGSQSSAFYRAKLILDESLFPGEIVEV